MPKQLTVFALALASALAVVRLPATSRPRAQARDPGRAVFDAHCASCHESDGKGTEGGPPPLEGSPWVTGSEPRLIKIVLHGVRGRIDVGGRTYNLEMPGFGGVLADSDVAAVLSFVRKSWGGAAEPITPAGVRRVRDANPNRTDYWTVDELLKEP